jgi:hypothetical protein
MSSLRDWLNTEVDPIIKPLVAQALIEQPDNFEEWLLEQLKNGGGGSSGSSGSSSGQTSARRSSAAGRRNSNSGQGNYGGGGDSDVESERQGKTKLTPDGEEYIDSESSEDEEDEVEPYTGPKFIMEQKINLNVLDKHGLVQSPVQATLVVKPLQAVNDFMGG